MNKKFLVIGYVEEKGRFYAETFVCDDESKIRDHAEEMLYVWGKLPILEADHYLIVSINDDGYPVVVHDYSKNRTHSDKGVFLTKMR